MSHTVKVDIKLKDKASVIKAAQVIGAQVLGEGTHKLYSSSHEGLGIKLPGWNYPIIIAKDGSVSYDNYNEAWGNITVLNQLKDVYSVKRVEEECHNLGWYCEAQPDGSLIVNHPTGGTITVTPGGEIDANGFTGKVCAEATEKLEAILGSRASELIKEEYNQNEVIQTQFED